MCDPVSIGLAVASITTTTMMQRHSAITANNAQREANEAQREGILKNQEFAGRLAERQAVEAATSAAEQEVSLGKKQVQAEGAMRAKNLTGLSGLALEREVTRRADNSRRMIGLNLDSAQQQARNAAEGSNISAQTQMANIIDPDFSGLGLEIAGSAIGTGLGAVNTYRQLNS